MSAVLIVVPVFALIAAGYAAVALRFISPTAHKGISEFAFSIAIPARDRVEPAAMQAVSAMPPKAQAISYLAMRL